jgi:hypothetical protein
MACPLIVPSISGVRPVRPLGAIVLLFALSSALTGCGSADENATPSACLAGVKPFQAALLQAPGAVQLPGGVLISDCLVRNQSAGELARVGEAVVRVATELNAAARHSPGAAPTIQLGYLVGALARGAADTQGIHTELLRRMEAAALYSPAGKPPPEPFDHRYQKGYAAGRDHG